MADTLQLAYGRSIKKLPGGGHRFFQRWGIVTDISDKQLVENRKHLTNRIVKLQSELAVMDKLNSDVDKLTAIK